MAEWAPITAPDIKALEEQAFQSLKPYYIQLAKEARGDYGRAKAILEEDYQKGTREAKADYARKADVERQELSSALEKLGVSTQQENLQKVDELNKRGMAVYESGPEGTPNVVSPNASLERLGAGGQQLAQLTKDQALRKEALNRASTRNLEELGVSLKKYTNAPSGSMEGPGVDRTKLGSSELERIRGIEDLTRKQQKGEQELFEKRRSEAQGLATTAAGLQVKEIPINLSARTTQNQMTDWVEKGV